MWNNAQSVKVTKKTGNTTTGNPLVTVSTRTKGAVHTQTNPETKQLTKQTHKSFYSLPSPLTKTLHLQVASLLATLIY